MTVSDRAASTLVLMEPFLTVKLGRDYSRLPVTPPCFQQECLLPSCLCRMRVWGRPFISSSVSGAAPQGPPEKPQLHLNMVWTVGSWTSSLSLLP